MRTEVAAIPGRLGQRAIEIAGATGKSSVFLWASFGGILRPPFRFHHIAKQIQFVGNRSIGIIVLTSSFTGMVLTLQGYTALVRFGSDAYLGPLVALSLIRELGPVLAALMVAARAGSSMAALIAGMRVTEQIDALEVMAVDSIQYLSSTRLLALLISAPILTAFFDLVGIGAAYVFGTSVLGIDGGAFMSRIRSAVEWTDISAGIWKSLVFGVIIAWVSCYQGYNARHGALGIGEAATKAVVSAAVLILATDYALTALFF